MTLKTPQQEVRRKQIKDVSSTKNRQLCNQHGHKKVPDLSIVSVMRPHR